MRKKNKFKQFVSLKDYSKEDILFILEVAQRMEKHTRLKANSKTLRNKILGLSGESISTETAMKNLGGEVIKYNLKEDIIEESRILAGHCDVIATRSDVEGTARLVSDSVTRAIINAGETHEDPCQILQDLFIIQKLTEELEKLDIGIIGNLKHNKRLHSFISILSLFNTRFYFISPEELQLPIKLLKELNENKRFFSEHNKVEEVIKDLDILYCTQLEEKDFVDLSEYEKQKKILTVSNSTLLETKEQFKLLSTLPNNMIKREVDKTKYAGYYAQSVAGIYVKQALLGLALGVIKFER
jgi:aspartate carbamoyltransferase catalytic subunit